MEQRQGRGGAFHLTPRPLGVLAALFVALATLAPTPSGAYHDTRSRPSAGIDLPLDVIVPIVVVVAVGIVALGVWSRKKPKGKVARRRARKRRGGRKTDGRRA